MQSNEITIQITSQMSADQLGEWINEVMADAAETLSHGESVAVKSVTPIEQPDAASVHPDLVAINALGMHLDMGGCTACRPDSAEATAPSDAAHHNH